MPTAQPPALQPRLTVACEIESGLQIRSGRQVTLIQPWGPDALRVRSALGAVQAGAKPGALHDQPPGSTADIVIGADGSATVTNGAIRAVVDRRGTITFTDADSGAELLGEQEQWLQSAPPRHLRPSGGELCRITATFRAYAGEKLYGLGQHQHGRLDQKGCVIDLVQQNTQIAIPFVVSSRGYGLLWNNPGAGRVELGHTNTRWIAEGARELDYWIVAGPTVAGTLSRYADLTGHAPAYPDWATGFFQSRLRYDNQQELLDVVHEHLGRGLPLSVIVIDFLHWSFHGDWRFDPQRWPDPAGMVAHLRELGVEVVVSIWPTVSERSSNYAEMQRQGMLLHSDELSIASRFVDVGHTGPAFLHYYDPSNPQARAYVWDQIRAGYYDLGIRGFWLDACEPELVAPDPAQWRYHAGPGVAVAGLYPHWNAQTLHDGLAGAGEPAALLLSRSAWAGSARYGVAIWSGDISASFEALRAQVPAGLNAGLSGMPWWSSDIGGFVTWVPNTDPQLRELIIRWFQFQVFTPLFRLHGHRRPDLEGEVLRGAPNELWSFGDEVLEAAAAMLRLREALRPYIGQHMAEATARGIPLMRPLFLDFPDDPVSWEVDDEFMFGPDILAAPVLDYRARARSVWLPGGVAWIDPWTGREYQGGQQVTIDVPLDRAGFFLRGGSPVATAVAEVLP
ncbi:TIM-barrel domain-containing protein [Dactylosporangium sp. NPDC000244]|uniref:glycoside hydrolase family 31 protein n=1 Tax=Dactylosporangium sp. NPDC000244 TaxID=3154365 RepID=UPI003324A6CA